MKHNGTGADNYTVADCNAWSYDASPANKASFPNFYYLIFVCERVVTVYQCVKCYQSF